MFSDFNEDEKERENGFIFNPNDFEEEDDFFFEDEEDDDFEAEVLEEKIEVQVEDDRYSNSQSDTPIFASEEDSQKNEKQEDQDDYSDSFESFSEQEEQNRNGEPEDSLSSDEDETYENDDQSSSEIEGREIGIDLGTTNSVVAYIDINGATKFIKVKNETLIPSFIFYKDKDTIYYGKKAKSYAKSMSQGAAVSLFKKH